MGWDSLQCRMKRGLGRAKGMPDKVHTQRNFECGTTLKHALGLAFRGHYHWVFIRMIMREVRLGTTSNFHANIKENVGGRVNCNL